MAISGLYTNVDGMIVAFVVFFGVGLFVAARVSRILFVAANFVEFFGFGRRLHGVLNQRRHSLSVRDGFCRDVLRQRVHDDRRLYGRNLHTRTFPKNDRRVHYYTNVINKHLIVLCKRFFELDAGKA